MIPYKVQPNKTILAPTGARFIVRGVQMFDYLFVSFEPRANYNFRSILNSEGYGAAAGVSEPTYYGRVQYQNAQNVHEQIRLAREAGANLLRVGVEPAIRYATASYVDPSDGIEYPSDLVMLDTILAAAESQGVVVQLQNCNDAVPTDVNISFLAWLADRYKDRAHVWINPANEMNGTNADVNNPTVWQAEMRQYVAAIRGAGFVGPICIDPPGWGERIDLIYSALTTDAVFRDDLNLILQPHFYPLSGQDDFRNDGLPTATARWFKYAPAFCIVVGEVGIDNFSGRYDPYLDPAIPSVSMGAWAQMRSCVSDFLSWANEQVTFSSFNGVIGHHWGAYIPGMCMHDDNSMRRNDGTWTTWGSIYRDKYLSAPILTAAQWGSFLFGVTTRQGNGTIGTPLFQAEGLVGVRAAAAMTSPDGASPILGFFRKDTGAMVGLVSGNGSGITYGTTSDYRLKADPSEVSEDEITAFFSALRPVMATWKETGAREPVFIAHEVQEVMPSAVSGVKDGTEYQTVDYSKIVPMLAAAVKRILLTGPAK